MTKDKLAVYEGTPRTGFTITVPGIGLFEKDKPKKVTTEQLKTLEGLDLGFREFDQKTEVAKPPMDVATESKTTKKKTAKKKSGKKTGKK